MRATLPILAAALVILQGCASTNVRPFEGGQPITGTGGARETVNGIDIWTHGTPPRTFRIVGVIDDARAPALPGVNNTLAKAAREVGGDAVIVTDSRLESVGTFTSPGSAGVTYGTAYALENTVHYHGQTYGRQAPSTHEVKDRVTTAFAVEYLD